MKLNDKQNKIHSHAVHTSRKRKRIESELVLALINVEEIKLYKLLDCSSLFKYALKYLELERAFAYSITTLARKCLKFPRLSHSVITEKLSVSKATRIISTVNDENAEALIAFAEVHSTEEINMEVARVRKKAGLTEKLSALYVSEETLSKVRRVRSLVGGDLDMALSAVLNEYIERHDPVKKAERAIRRKAKRVNSEAVTMEEHKFEPVEEKTDSFCINRKYSKPQRQPLMAEQEHAVWAVAQGGSNEPDNLTLLCGFHHDLDHQLSFPIDGQISWLR